MNLVWRTVQQRLWIADTITVQVLAVERGRVVFGIEAPAEISVKRAERLARLLSPLNENHSQQKGAIGPNACNETQ